jgi:HTH-type transcriptional regulator, global nitrogen regulator NrpRI
MKQQLKVAMLRVLRDANGPIGSAQIAEDIQLYGMDLGPRSVRLRLKELASDGLVAASRRGRGGGRTITDKGIAEIGDALVQDRVGFASAKIDSLACRTTFDPATGLGDIVLNLSTAHASLIRPILRSMLPVFTSDFSMGKYACVFEPGTKVGRFTVPPGKVAIGTVCSVTVNGVLLSRGIPTVSKFGGILEIFDHQPLRFTDVIYYESTSLDPLTVFIKGGLTSLNNIWKTGRGRIGASFREVPTVMLSLVKETLAQLEAVGLGCVLTIGQPNRPVLGFPVSEGRTGLILVGGLNPLASVEQSGVSAGNSAMAELYDFAKLETYTELAERFGVKLP